LTSGGGRGGGVQRLKARNQRPCRR
jgi:hypothetical protein